MLFRKIKFDPRAVSHRVAFAFTSVALVVFGVNLAVAEMDRPQLLGRTFDRTYIVKYLGLDTFTAYDLVKTEHVNDMRKSATKSELEKVKKFTDSHYASPNVKMYGIAKGRNVIVIHLESFQQFLINLKVNGQEVTPFLNSLYKSKETYAFDNFFHQVGQGKTSDAENLLETSTFGLSQGSLFATLGSDNTFEAAPAILNQRAGYTSSVFHGNVASFWNRNNVYKNMGYQYFFDASYYDTSGDKSTGYGLKDKLLFKDSIKYLENLQQPFYVKYITVTNHFPFDLDSEDTDPNFTAPDTGSTTVDNYFVTAHYLDQAVKEFFTYLDKSGLAKKSIIVLYGDHYGISDNHKAAIAKILGKKSVTNYDLAMFQKVPFMINMEGLKGGIDHTYGGEIDVLPTIEDLLGISSDKYIQFGQDLLSTKRNQIVPFRDGDWVSKTYTKYGGDYYYTATGKPITKMTTSQKKQIDKIQKYVTTDLALSDKVINGDLLRFYKLPGFTKVNKSSYTYNAQKSLANLKKVQQKKKTSLLAENAWKSLFDDYTTDAPEIANKTLKFPTK